MKKTPISMVNPQVFEEEITPFYNNSFRNREGKNITNLFYVANIILFL